MSISKMFIRFDARVFLRSAAAIMATLLCSTTVGAVEPGSELILKPERQISFTTDEGTWMSLDVSPSSETLVFDLLGDLYTVSSQGGNASVISSGMAFDSQPVFSPDGSKIAFISDRSGSENVWVANVDGSNPQQVSFNKFGRMTSPAWSADGSWIYVSKATLPLSTPVLWMYHIDGGNGIVLNGAKSGSVNELGAYATADGKYLYYSRRAGALWGKNFSLWNISRRDLDTGRQEQVLSIAGSSMRPVVSPDGRYLAYTRRLENSTELRIRDLLTAQDRRLVHPVTRDMQEAVGTRDMYPGYDFTPDGSEIVISYGGKIKRVNVNSGAVKDIPFLAQVNLDVAPSLKLAQTNPVGPLQARVIQTPRLSPDGERLTFSAFGKIYVMPASGGSPRRLTDTAISTDGITENYPSWSPDGRWITYVTWGAGNNTDGGHIWKVRANGGRPAQLTEIPAFYRRPIFTPDGKSVVAVRGSTYDRTQIYKEDRNHADMQHLVQVSSKGGKLDVLTSIANHDTGVISNALITDFVGQPHIGTDGQHVYIYSAEGMLKVPLNGGDGQKIIQVTVPDFYAENKQAPVEEAVFSPDGNWLLALSDARLYLVAVPHTGNKDLEINLSNPAVPVKQLTDIGADYFAWADNGKTITWSVGSTFYQLALDSVNFSDSRGDNAGFAENLAQRMDIQVSLDRDTPSGTVVLRGATAITMKGDEIIQNADIVVKGNRIIAIGARGQVPVPADAEIRDFSGRYITPGFVDTHAHWMPIPHEVLDYNPWTYPVNLAYGVTAGLDVQGMTHDQFYYQDLIDAGVFPGPRAYTVGRGVFRSNNFTSRKHALGVLTRYKKHYRTNNIKAYLSGNRLQRQYVVSAARELGLMPTTEGGANTKMDLTHAIDGFAGNEHTVPVTPLYKDIIQLYAQTGIGYTPTLQVSYGGPSGIEAFYAHQSPLDDAKLNRFTPRQFIADRALRRSSGIHSNEHIYPRVAKSATDIFRAGGKIGIGSHGELQGLGYHWEMQAMTEGGATPHEVLQMATISSAEVIGQHKELGSLEPGKFADSVVFEKNPLENIRNTVSIDYVMKNGRLYNGDDLKEVWPAR